jgi:hypothetical protein
LRSRAALGQSWLTLRGFVSPHVSRGLRQFPDELIPALGAGGLGLEVAF